MTQGFLSLQNSLNHRGRGVRRLLIIHPFTLHTCCSQMELHLLLTNLICHPDCVILFFPNLDPCQNKRHVIICFCRIPGDTATSPWGAKKQTAHDFWPGHESCRWTTGAARARGKREHSFGEFDFLLSHKTNNVICFVYHYYNVIPGNEHENVCCHLPKTDIPDFPHVLQNLQILKAFGGIEMTKLE